MKENTKVTWLTEAERPNFWGSVWQFQAKGVDGKIPEISGILTNGEGQPPASINNTEQVRFSASRDAITAPAEPAPTEKHDTTFHIMKSSYLQKKTN